MAVTSVREFATTLTSQERTGKIAIRDKVFNTISKLIDTIPKRRFKVLSLPSIYWVFEEKLMKHLVKEYKGEKAITLHGFEHDWKLFCVSCLKIPKSYSNGYQQVMEERLNYQKVKTAYVNNYINLHHINVFDYLKNTDNLFDFMWIDLTSPIDYVRNDIAFAANTLELNGILVLSFPKGRERIKIADRTRFVLDILHNMELIEEFEYMDTSPMCNLILRRKSLIEVEAIYQKVL